MNFIPLIIIFMLAFLLQYLFTFVQMRNFNVYYKKMRNQGRVAIGTKKGKLKAGVIVMLAIDKDGHVLDGAYLEGVTIFARFKCMQHFVGAKIESIDKERLCQERLTKGVKKTILEAISNYKMFVSGEEIKPKDGFMKSTLQKFRHIEAE